MTERRSASFSNAGTPFIQTLIDDTAVFFVRAFVQSVDWTRCQERFSYLKDTKILRSGPHWESLYRAPLDPSWFLRGRFAAGQRRGVKGKETRGGKEGKGGKARRLPIRVKEKLTVNEGIG